MATEKRFSARIHKPTRPRRRKKEKAPSDVVALSAFSRLEKSEFYPSINSRFHNYNQTQSDINYALWHHPHQPKPIKYIAAANDQKGYNSTDPLDSVTMFALENFSSDGPLFYIINKAVEMIMGKGFEPQLVLRHPTGTDEDQKEVEKDEAKKAVRFIKAVMDQIGDNDASEDDGVLYRNFTEIMDSVCKIMLVYHRCAVLKHKVKDFEFEGVTCKIPRIMQILHPKNLGMVHHNDFGAITMVQRTYPNYGEIAFKDMIYCTNTMLGAHISNSEGFGASPALGLIPVLRMINKMENEDMPTMLRISWSGIPVFMIDMPGATKQKKQQVLAELADSTAAGGPIYLAIHKDNVGVENLKIDAKISDTRELYIMFLKQMCAHYNVPANFISDTADANRSTLPQKMQVQFEVGTAPQRERLFAPFINQFFQPLLKECFPEIDEKFKLVLRVRNLDTESMAQRVESAMAIHAGFPLTPYSFGLFIGDDRFYSKIDKDMFEAVNNNIKMGDMPNPNPATGPRKPGGANGGSGARETNVSKKDSQGKGDKSQYRKPKSQG